MSDHRGTPTDFAPCCCAWSRRVADERVSRPGVGLPAARRLCGLPVAEPGSIDRARERGRARVGAGATDTVVAVAQIVAPYVAGWLYASSPAYPFVASLVLIPLAILLTRLQN